MHFSRRNLYEVGKKRHQYSIVTLCSIWLFFLRGLCVVFCICGWHFWEFFRQVCICCLLSSPFVIHLTINLKEKKKDCWNIYFHLDNNHIFWLHFEFNSSDGKLVKHCPEPEIWKAVTKFNVSLLSCNQTWEPQSCTFECISWIDFPELWCKGAGNNFHIVFSVHLHFVLPKKTIWM